MPKEIDPSEGYHALDADEVMRRLGTSLKGLDQDTADKRLTRDGPNEIPRVKRSFLRAMAPQIFDFVILLLICIAILMAFLTWLFPENESTSFETSIAIVFVIVLSWILIIIQMYSAERSLESLRKIGGAKANVLRDGRWVQVPRVKLVMGDMVRITEGERVPADMRMITSDGLMVDESSLTGESITVEKDIEPVRSPNPSLHEMTCMAFMSTVVTRGTAEGVVTGVGVGTELGKIANEIRDAPEPQIPLQRKMSQLARTLSLILFFMIFLLFMIQILRLWIRGDLVPETAVEQMVNAVILSVVAVPWSFPIITTSVMVRGMMYLVKENAIVRRVASIEALGRVSVICSDKTGTMTENAMTVRKIYQDGKTFDVTGSGYEPKGSVTLNGSEIDVGKSHFLRLMLEAASLVNDAKLINEDNEWHILGDPTEGALKTLGEKAGLGRELEGHHSIREVPFSSDRKMMTKVFPKGKGHVAYVKGGFEAIVGSCDRMLDNGRIVEMDKGLLKKAMDANDKISSRAMRTLAFAYRDIEGPLDELSDAELEGHLTFLGLVGMIDPPKKGVKDAVLKCHAAGIKVVMITGDSKVTATAIARELGVLRDRDLIVEGSQMPIDPNMLGDVKVFCRVNPKQKVDIVKAYRKSGHIIAMTGDGMNDAAALKNADVGVAMGLNGVDVAKEASQIILADDNFSTLVTAVHRGRQIFDNIRKSITYQIYTNIGELSVMFLGSLIFLEQMMTDKHLLFLYFSTHIFPVAALVLDRTSTSVMKEPPRDVKEGIVSSKVLGSLAVMIMTMALISLSLFFLFNKGIIDIGMEGDRSGTVQTMILVFMVWGESFNLFNSLSLRGSLIRQIKEKNMFLPILLTMVPITALTSLMYIGNWGQGLDLVRLTPLQYSISVLSGSLIIPVVELWKIYLRFLRRGKYQTVQP